MPVYVTPADAAAEPADGRGLGGGDAWPRRPCRDGADGEGPAGRGAARGRRRGALFSFADLCEKPLGARDYLAIAGRFSTRSSSTMCRCSAEGKRNEAKRFILLIDTLYDQHVRLVVSAEAPPQALYTAARRTRPSSSSAPPRG